MNEINKLFGAQVKSARKALRMNQEDLASDVGISRTAITNIECGKQGTTIEMLYKLASALELGPEKLLPPISPLDPTSIVGNENDAERINRLLNTSE